MCLWKPEQEADVKSECAQIHTMKAYRGNAAIAQLIINLDTRWRWVFSLTTRPLNPRDKTPVSTE